MSGENWFRLLIVGIGLAGAGVILLIVYLVRARCPACRKPTIELDLAANPGGIEPRTGGMMFRCTACGAEYRRDQEGGPFIPRGAWEEGARGEVPKARALRRNRR